MSDITKRNLLLVACLGVDLVLTLAFYFLSGLGIPGMIDIPSLVTPLALGIAFLGMSYSGRDVIASVAALSSHSLDEPTKHLAMRFFPSLLRSLWLAGVMITLLISMLAILTLQDQTSISLWVSFSLLSLFYMAKLSLLFVIPAYLIVRCRPILAPPPADDEAMPKLPFSVSRVFSVLLLLLFIGYAYNYAIKGIESLMLISMGLISVGGMSVWFFIWRSRRDTLQIVRIYSGVYLFILVTPIHFIILNPLWMEINARQALASFLLLFFIGILFMGAVVHPWADRQPNTDTSWINRGLTGLLPLLALGAFAFCMNGLGRYFRGEYIFLSF